MRPTKKALYQNLKMCFGHMKTRRQHGSHSNSKRNNFDEDPRAAKDAVERDVPDSKEKAEDVQHRSRNLTR